MDVGLENEFPKTPPEYEKSAIDKEKTTGLTIDSFTFIKLLGVGAYGRVSLVQHKKSGSLFAMKTMEKSVFVTNRQVRHVLSEKATLQKSSHPNVVKLYGTMNDAANIYMILEYLPAGALLRFIQQESRFSDRVAAFYATNIVLAIEYLHSRGIVHRDLKPENLALSANGYLKLIDFGYAKQIGSRAFTFCGTPDYLAPEVIEGTGHGIEVDYWSLGILIYEMLVGRTPFSQQGKESRNKLFERILNTEIKYPKHVNCQARDLIGKLLVRDPCQRLGFANSSRSITEHSWFDGIDTSAVYAQALSAPYKQ